MLFWVIWSPKVMVVMVVVVTSWCLLFLQRNLLQGRQCIRSF